ncbi:permease [human gut metagenome]|uniref:Permease n=1 Tax=human gut metagenome TaxID=408170 RepID=K1UD77_9ZZZZ
MQLILLWTHASACLQGSTKLEWKKILTNVNLIAIVAGALLYLLHISLPAPIVSTLSSVGNMIGPMGMLLAGMAIAEVPLKKVFCTLRNYLPVVLRLLWFLSLFFYYSGWYMQQVGFPMARQF